MVHELAASQKLMVEKLLELLMIRGEWRSVVSVGPPGSGKRTIARAAAQRLDIGFLEVPMNDVTQALHARLFGTPEEAMAAVSGEGPPGECGRSGPLLLYLSGLDAIHEQMMHCIHRLVTTRTYVDACGHKWRLADDVLIVGSLRYPFVEATVAANHWLLTGFSHWLRVEPPSSEADLSTICRSILHDLERGQEVQLAFGDVLGHIAGCQVDLNALRRWVETAKYLAGDIAAITAGVFQQAIAEDVRSLLPLVPYRGRQLALEHFQRWAAQFPEDLRPLTVSLLAQIADRYYIGDTKYYKALGELVKRSGIPPGEGVVFCRWQSLGRSAPRIAHDLKNIARWRVIGEVDLERSEQWPIAGKAKWLVLADDFIGSGKALSSFACATNDKLATFLRDYSEAEVRMVAVAGFRGGLQRARKALVLLADRVKMDVFFLFGEEDTCFHDNSRILTRTQVRVSFRSFCLTVADNYFTSLCGTFRLGYGGLGALVVFSNTVPNNSLPLLWYDQSKWIPLFPASGLLPNGHAHGEEAF